MSKISLAKLQWSQFVSNYGMFFVLLIIVAVFSVITIEDQPIRGAAAGESLAQTLNAETGKALLVVSASQDDKALQLAFTEALDDTQRVVAIIEADKPTDGKKAITSALSQHTGPMPTFIICSKTTSAWTFYNSIEGLKDARILQPKQEKRSNFLKKGNLKSLPLKMSKMAIIAIGMTMVIITAGIDLSVGSLLAFAAVCSAWLIRQYGGEEAGYLVVLGCFTMGALSCAFMGYLTGLSITLFRIPPFIATLAMMLVARGIAKNIAQDNIITGMPSAVFENLFHLKLNLGFTTINLPTPILLMVALYIIFHIIMTHTRLGRHVYAIGGNPEAARLSGVPVNRVLLIVYSISGLMAGIAGVIMCTEYKSGKGIWGVALELDVIAAVVVGGTSLMGGRGRILGTLIGCAIIVVIKNGMNLMSLRDNTQNIVLGLVILAAIIIDQFKKGEYSWGTSRK